MFDHMLSLVTILVEAGMDGRHGRSGLLVLE